MTDLDRLEVEQLIRAEMDKNSPGCAGCLLLLVLLVSLGVGIRFFAHEHQEIKARLGAVERKPNVAETEP